MGGRRKVLGYTLAILGLAWVLHNIGPGRLAKNLVIRDWRFVPAAVVADVLSYVAQAYRWRLLLSPVGQISVMGAIEAVYTGLFFNEILPMRPGELVRALIAGRLLDVRLSAVLPSVAVE